VAVKVENDSTYQVRNGETRTCVGREEIRERRENFKNIVRHCALTSVSWDPRWDSRSTIRHRSGQLSLCCNCSSCAQACPGLVAKTCSAIAQDTYSLLSDILVSYTWGEEEVTFEDINEDCSRMHHIRRLSTHNQAAQDSYKFTLVDTCCIDKSSSVELSEAINSMFKWYKASVLCLPHSCIER